MIAQQDTENLISSPQELRALVGEPSALATGRFIDHVDTICRDFIAASSFLLVATRSPDGTLEISSKGDRPGFVEVVDPGTLVIPERAGDKRVASLMNILQDDQVGLFFLIPGHGHTLKISGRAHLVRPAAAQDNAGGAGKPVMVHTIVKVEKAFINCAKSISRAQLWRDEHALEGHALPSFAEVLSAHGGKMVDDREEKNLVP